MRLMPLWAVPEFEASTADMIREAWPEYYGANSPGDAAADIRNRSRRAGLPYGVTAVCNGQVVGTGALSGTSYGGAVGEDVWIVGLFVRPPNRNTGIASSIVATLEDQALDLGHAHVFSTTRTADGLLARRGWSHLRQFRDEKGIWSVMRQTL